MSTAGSGGRASGNRVLCSSALCGLVLCWMSVCCTSTASSEPAVSDERMRELRALPYSEVRVPPRESPLGTNLSALADYSPEWAFVDAFKQSRVWISSNEHSWDDKRPLDLDEHGWVRSLQSGQWARALMFWADELDFPSGDYTVSYDGKGEIRYWNNAELLQHRPGRDIVRVRKGQGGICLIISQTDPSDYVRNIRVKMPGGVCRSQPDILCRSSKDCTAGACQRFSSPDSQEVFHPTFLARLNSYSTIRFMDWMKTNNSKQRDWHTRPTPRDARWTGRGVPVEIMVQLANRLGVDPWFTLPHDASDRYIENFASIVRDTMKPGLKAYVEYSNEVWNGAFKQARYAGDRGRAAGLSSNRFEGQLRYYARRSVALFGIWERVFGGTHRIRRVLASQAANPWVSETVLRFEDAAKHADALAIAPYFGGEYGYDQDRINETRAMSVNVLVRDLGRRAVPSAIAAVRKQAKVAAKFSLPLIAYEGGQHLVGVGPAIDDKLLNRLFDAANRHPDMREIYLLYLEGWKSAGGQLFVHYLNVYKPLKFGRWGALESLQQPPNQAPKFNALRTFTHHHRSWWHSHGNKE